MAEAPAPLKASDVVGVQLGHIGTHLGVAAARLLK